MIESVSTASDLVGFVEALNCMEGQSIDVVELLLELLDRTASLSRIHTGKLVAYSILMPEKACQAVQQDRIGILNSSVGILAEAVRPPLTPYRNFGNRTSFHSAVDVAAVEKDTRVANGTQP